MALLAARTIAPNLDLGRGLSGTHCCATTHAAMAVRRGGTSPRTINGKASPTTSCDCSITGSHERVHGVGPSMGTGTPLHAASREPERFTGLTLWCHPTAWETRPAQAATTSCRGRLSNLTVSRHSSPPRGAAPPPATIACRRRCSRRRRPVAVVVSRRGTWAICSLLEGATSRESTYRRQSWRGSMIRATRCQPRNPCRTAPASNADGRPHPMRCRNLT